jgi:hypothetical protein
VRSSGGALESKQEDAMGAEAWCTASFDGKTSQGKALLETRELVFRGEFRLKISFSSVQEVRATDGALIVKFADGVARFKLGRQAEAWAKKIQSPPSLLAKLGVKPGFKTWVIGSLGNEFLGELRQRTGVEPVLAPEPECDLIFLAADDRAQLERLASLLPRIKPNGAIWVVRPKGAATITERDVLAAGRAAGLTDIKVVAFSPTHTAEKLVVPLARR